jgi:hypothetical protein
MCFLSILPFKRERGGFRKRKEKREREGGREKREGRRRERQRERQRESIRINRLTFYVF